jgi:hypothetical protein
VRSATCGPPLGSREYAASFNLPPPAPVCIEVQRETADRIHAYFAAHGYAEVARYLPLDRVNRYFAPASGAAGR